jgi:hypothetical protein
MSISVTYVFEFFVTYVLDRYTALNLAFGSPRATAACGGAENSPDVVGLRQFGRNKHPCCVNNMASNA